MDRSAFPSGPAYLRVYLGPCLGALLILAALSGCAHKKHARHTPPPPPPAAAPAVGDTETGIASWYGKPYDGRPAADGEIYDMEKLTAAHRTLPFNTWVRVYDLDTNKTVEVRITDRGPFVGGRIIDLSHRAAREIEMIGPGTARVRVEVIRAPEGVSPFTVNSGVFAVQVGAFRDRANAERLRGRMESLYGSARLVQRAEKPDFWFVLAGREASEDAAKALASQICPNSGEKNGCFVVRIDTE
ncbi:MAG TPA: septal ring lytic transglycosylase RlpA family protein [Candidatus Acidoferrales bacterium]|nr:septal ring lytic transglycosylase RlpA family protein [Candidatus Acidoferrales bacterium]